jgi:hypothetical protein
MSVPQTYKNHTRFDPIFHFILMPLLLLNFAFSIYIAVHHWPEQPHLHLWWIVMAVVFILIAGNGRGSALKAQDRVIRLEERLRLTALLPVEEHHLIAQLTPRQFIALRFASDDELPALSRKTVAQNLEPKAIKESIVNWRPDHNRV